MEQRRAALVLSGGGALGAAHIGVALELAASGYQFDYFAGVSAGAVIASTLAVGFSPDECLSLLRKTKLFKLLFDVGLGAHGLMSGTKLYRLLEDIYGPRRIEDLPAPLRIGVTDFSSGERVVIESGKVVDAVRASVSVPMLFKPFYHTELKRWLADGGLSQNLPLDVAVNGYRGDTIIAVDVATALDEAVDFSSDDGPGWKALAVRTVRIMLKNQQQALPSDPRVVLVKPELSSFSAIDVNKLEHFIQLGRHAAAKCA